MDMNNQIWIIFIKIKLIIQIKIFKLPTKEWFKVRLQINNNNNIHNYITCSLLI